MDISNYLNNPDDFIKELTFDNKGKVRHIITYEGELGEELRSLHKEILAHLNVLPSSKLSYAYKQNVKISHAINCHLGNITYIKLDIKSFFESIDYDILLEKIKPYNLDISFGYCFYKNTLPIGYVTSPKISDFYLYDLDTSVEEYLKNHPSLKYSRYADDFLLSSPNDTFDELLGLAKFIKEQLKKVKLELNEKKTIKVDLRKSTSIRFLGLNVGLNKVTVSKWYILKTINAYKAFVEANKSGDKNAQLLRSIAYGYESFIKENSPTSFERFRRKYHLLFAATINERPIDNLDLGIVRYLLNEDKKHYTAIIESAPGYRPDEISINDLVSGLRVTRVKFDHNTTLYNTVRRFKLSKYTRSIDIDWSKMPNIKNNPILDIVDLKKFIPHNEYDDVCEVGFSEPPVIDSTESRKIYRVKKLDNGYLAELVTYAQFDKPGDDYYEESKVHFVPESPESHRIFSYLAESIREARYEYRINNFSYVIFDENKRIKSPLITIEMLGAMQYFFKEIINMSTQLPRLDDEGAIPFVEALDSFTTPISDMFEIELPYEEGNVKVRIDFDYSPYEYDINMWLNKKIDKETSETKYTTWKISKDYRIKELLLSYLSNEQVDKPIVTIRYRNDEYHLNKLPTSLYNLLSYVCPSQFNVRKDYLLDDGTGEYIALGYYVKPTESNAFKDNLTIRKVRFFDEFEELPPGAFIGCKNLRFVFLTRKFFRIVFFGPCLPIDTFTDCPNLVFPYELFPFGTTLVAPSDEDLLAIQNDIRKRVITRILPDAFKGCSDKVINLNLNTKIDRLEEDTFKDMPNLRSVTLKSVGTIVKGAFKNCPKLKEVYIDDIDVIEEDAAINCHKDIKFISAERKKR